MRRQTNPLSVQLVESANDITANDDKIFGFLQKQPVISWMVTADAKQFWFNDAWYSFAGKTPEDMVDWAWQDYLPDEDVPRVATSFCTALGSEQPWIEIYRIKNALGEYRQVLAQGAPLHNSRGDIQYWLGSTMDITELPIVKKLPRP